MRVLVLFAHPAQREASINLSMSNAARRVEGITFVDLYSEYPRFEIDIDREQERLMAHDVIVLQFPVYWYSTPALLKEWQDLVLEYGFAYGPDGKALTGKTMIAAVTTGGRMRDYMPGGGNNHTLRELLLPLQQTAVLCGIRFAAPYALFGANQIEAEAAQLHIAGYPELLSAIRDDRFDIGEALRLETFGASELANLARS